MDAQRLTYQMNREQGLESLYQSFPEMWAALLTACQQWRKSAISTVTYLIVIATVSIYDILLTIQYRESLKQLEENPIGRWLMNLDRTEQVSASDLALFLVMKSIGTIIVLVTVYTLIKRCGRIGHPIAAGVTSFQLGLAAHLTFSGSF
jgi:hypothetical protein